MRFIESVLQANQKKILINIDQIKTVVDLGDIVEVCTGESDFELNEGYESLVAKIKQSTELPGLLPYGPQQSVPIQLLKTPEVSGVQVY